MVAWSDTKEAGACALCGVGGALCQNQPCGHSMHHECYRMLARPEECAGCKQPLGSIKYIDNCGLERAVAQGCEEAALRSLRSGANPHAWVLGPPGVRPRMLTCLQAAVLKGQSRCVWALLAAGAEVCAPTLEGGSTALDMALLKGNCLWALILACPNGWSTPSRLERVLLGDCPGAAAVAMAATPRGALRPAAAASLVASCLLRTGASDRASALAAQWQVAPAHVAAHLAMWGCSRAGVAEALSQPPSPVALAPTAAALLGPASADARLRLPPLLEAIVGSY